MDLRVRLESRENLVRWVYLARRDLTALRVCQVPLDLQDPRVSQEPPVLRENKVHLVLQVLQVPQGNCRSYHPSCSSNEMPPTILKSLIAIRDRHVPLDVEPTTSRNPEMTDST